MYIFIDLRYQRLLFVLKTPCLKALWCKDFLKLRKDHRNVSQILSIFLYKQVLLSCRLLSICIYSCLRTNKILWTIIRHNNSTIVLLFYFKSYAAKSFIGFIQIGALPWIQVRLPTEGIYKICPVTDHLKPCTYVGGC